MIIFGVDPGLTRCGVGVVEAGASRRLSFIHVDVVRSDPHMSQDLRLKAIYNGLCAKMDRFIPDAVSIERVFAQANRNTVLGTAQAAGLAMLAAAQRGIPVALHGGEREEHLTEAQKQRALAAQQAAKARHRKNVDRGM